MCVASCRCRSKDGRELPLLVHWREGNWTFWKASSLQGFRIPSCYPRFHVPGWRFHCWKWNRGWVNLWKQVPRWELCAQAHWTRNPQYGQCWTKHEWFPVLLVYYRYCMVGWQACCIWICDKGYGRGQGCGIIWKPDWKNIQENCHWQLWTVVLSLLYWNIIPHDVLH